MSLVGLEKLPEWTVVAAEVSENARYLAVGEAGFRLALLELPGMNVLNETIIGGAPLDIEVDASGRLIYVITNNATFWVYSSASGTSDILELPLQPRRLALRPPEKSEAWVVCGERNSILVIDLPQLARVDTIELPQPPTDIQFSPDGSRYYVTMLGDTGTLAAFYTASRQLIQAQPIGRGAFELAVSDDGRYVAASDSATGKVHVWDTVGGPVWSVQIGGYPLRIRFGKRSHTFFVLSVGYRRIQRMSIADNGPVLDDALIMPENALEFVLWENPQ